jgi:hypothetical protein
LVIFEIGFLFLPKPAWSMNPLTHDSCYKWADRYESPHPSFFPLRWDLTNFCALADLELWSSQSQSPT